MNIWAESSLHGNQRVFQQSTAATVNNQALGLIARATDLQGQLKIQTCPVSSADERYQWDMVRAEN
jgi:hypothetical protein